MRVIGKVKMGQKVGRRLGFPTANISLHQNISSGIYISKVKLENKTYPALSYIGKKTTLESHLFNFSKNIYNKWLSVKLLKKIREDKEFESESDLLKQMEMDKKKALEYFKNYV